MIFINEQFKITSEQRIVHEQETNFRAKVASLGTGITLSNWDYIHTPAKMSMHERQMKCAENPEPI
jgi:hypothetical protein